MKSFQHLRVPTILKNFSIVCLCCSICLYFSAANFLDRNSAREEERGLVFPVFTVVQFAVGLAVPVQVPNRSVVTNLGVLSNLPLPSKINQLYPYVGKGRQLTHDYLYESLKTAWNWSNSDGKECLLKTICQVSGLNSEKGELIFNVLRLLFSPSSLKFPVAKTHYMIAEQIVIILINLRNDDNQVVGTSDQERALVISSGGFIKLIVGLSVPLELPISVNFIQNIQYQYAMIDNATQLSYLNLLRSNEKFNLSRNTAYKFLIDIWNSIGVNGTACTLQMICGIGKYSLSHEGIFGEIVDTIFTPHAASEEKYKEARRLGKLGKNCKKTYPHCKKNILDHVTKIVRIEY